MKKALIAAAVLSTFGASAFAAGAFDGAYAGLSLGGANKSVEVTGNGNNIAVGSTRFVGQVNTGYSYAFGTFNIAGGAFSQFGGQNAMTANGQSLKMKNVWGLTVEPGAYIGDKTLAYAKLGYARAAVGSDAQTVQKDGFLYGVGIKHLITSNVYAGLEVQQIKFESNTQNGQTVRPAQFSGMATVGYKF